MLCEYCKETHSGEYGSGRFCCKKCASAFSTFSKRKEINLKVSEKLIGRSPSNKGKKQSQEHIEKRLSAINEETRNRISEKVKKKRENLYLSKMFEDLSSGQKRRRVFEEQNFKCHNCGIFEWLGQPIKLELEHKDGNTNNNDRNNLEGLCPNCHSFTMTWRKRKSALVVE